LANFRYDAKSTLTNDPTKDAEQLMLSDLHTSDQGSFDSVCGQTMVGFVQQKSEESTMTEHQVQCFFAKQNKSLDIENTFEEQSNGLKFAKIQSHGPGSHSEK
jgi:hypothetical protein